MIIRKMVSPSCMAAAIVIIVYINVWWLQNPETTAMQAFLNFKFEAIAACVLAYIALLLKGK